MRTQQWVNKRLIHLQLKFLIIVILLSLYMASTGHEPLIRVCFLFLWKITFFEQGRCFQEIYIERSNVGSLGKFFWQVANFIFDLSRSARDPKSQRNSEWQIPRRGPGEPASPLFLDQTEPLRAGKIFLETAPPPYLRVRMTGTPSYLKVCIWHWHCLHPYRELKSLSPVSLGPGFIVGKKAKNRVKQRKKSVREESREVDALSPPQIPVRLANFSAFSRHCGVCSRATPGLLVCM